MSRDLDTLGRRAAANLKAAVAEAELRSATPGRPRRRLIAVFRPAWAAAVVLLGSTVGLALVLEPDPPPTTAPPTTATTLAPTTTPPPEPTAPTTVAVVPATSKVTIPDVDAPHLTITSPAEGAVVEEPTVTVIGVTEPGATVFTAGAEIEVDSAGGWSTTWALAPGANRAVFVARDAVGNEAEVSLTVHYQAPTTTTTTVPTTTTTVKDLAEFSAYATFGSCAVTPPYDVYYGTGEPGSTVQVTSEHGSASVPVGENGQWEVKVVFETAPPDVAFPVKVSDQYGRKAVFEFIYTP